MTEPKSAPGSKPSNGGGGKKGGGGVAIAIGAVLLGAVVFGGPKLKAMLGGKAEVDAADSAEGKAGKKKRKVKRVVNGEEREVEEVVGDDDAAAYDSTNPPVNPADRERWEKEREERRKQRQQALEEYIRESRLGPTTHAMGEEGIGYDGIVKPNARHESPLALRKFSTDANNPKNPESREEQKKSKYAMLTGDVYNVYPGVPLVARLTVTQGNPRTDQLAPPLEPIAVSLVSARLTKRGADGKPVLLGDFPLNDQGQFGDTQSGDRVYSGSLDPTKVKGLDGEVTLTAVFSVPGESGEYAVPLDWNVIAKPHATITGPKGDALAEGGSLDVYVGVNVNEPGQYHFQAVIADQKGANLGWAEGRPTLDRGAQTITLNYYGLLFQEKKVDGPYTVNLVYGTHIHGARMDQTAAVAEWSGSYATKPYKASQFTSEQSQDPERTRRIAQFQDEVARNPGAVTKDGPDMILDESGNLVPGNGRAVPPGSIDLPKETPKAPLPAEPAPTPPTQPTPPGPKP